jgi:very-short-patch-repair endonuclease
MSQLSFPSPLAGEGGSRAAAEGSGGASRSATQKTISEFLERRALLKERARHMRANPTDAERKLWGLLRNHRFADLKWKRQQVIDDLYIVDFICFEHRMIVEADGGQHADNRHDKLRDRYLAQQDFAVLRFWNNEILTNLDGVSEAILGAINSLAAQTRGDPTPNPLPQGERALRGNSNV